MGKGALTPKQAVFVQEYLIDLNATQASIRAGYSEKSARRTGARNMLKPAVREAIAEAMEERKKRTFVSQDGVIEELSRIAFGNIEDFTIMGSDGSLEVCLDGMGRDKLAAIKDFSMEPKGDGYKCTIRLHNKIQALQLLGKHLGMFAENHNHKIESGGVLLVPAPVSSDEWEVAAKNQQAQLLRDEND